MSYPLSLPQDKPLLTLTHPDSRIWVIEMHNGDDSRLNPAVVAGAFQPMLDQVEKDWRESRREGKGEHAGHGALVIVGNRKQDKFFSNGLSPDTLQNSAGFFPMTFNPFLQRLLTFPIPTVAAVNGHCFAGGMMVSLACDFRVMTDGLKRRTWMCMNEVHFGAPWPESFIAVLRSKFGDTRLHRKVALEGRRFTPHEALEAGLVDLLAEGGTTEAVLAQAIRLAEQHSELAKSGCYGLIKTSLYADAVQVCRTGDLRVRRVAEVDAEARAKL